MALTLPPKKFKTRTAAIKHLTDLGWSISGKSQGDVVMGNPNKAFVNVISQKAKGGWSILAYGTLVLDKPVLKKNRNDIAEK